MQIERHNAWSRIRHAPAWFLNYLGRHLSVPVEPGTEEGHRFGAMWSHNGKRYGTLVKGDTVPAGLTPHVESLARYYGLHLHVTDARRPPDQAIPWFSVSARWRPYQESVHHQIVHNPCGVIDAPPRSGKTLMAARAIDVLALPAVYSAPSVAIVRQTYRVFCEHFGDHLVGRLDGHQKDPDKSIVVGTPNTLVTMPPEWWDRRDVLIIDEFHHSAAETYHRINALAQNVYYRYGFTGTHFRTGDDRLAMEAVCSYVLYRIPVAYLVRNGWLARPRVFFLPIHGPSARAADWRVAYKRGIVEHEARNDRVVQVVEALQARGVPTIVLTKRRAHADALGDRIEHSVVVKGGEGALTSRSVRDFLAGRREVLIGTGVIGEGVDVPRAAALVYAAGGSDGVAMMQSYFRPLTATDEKDVGRVYDFMDYHHGTLCKHSERRLSMARDQLGEAGEVLVVP